MSIRFQLVYNGDIDHKIDLIEIMPEIARILEVDAQFVGALFKRESVVLLESDEFKHILKKQKALEKIGIYSDIKPLPKGNLAESPEKAPDRKTPEQTSSIYRSVFKVSDDAKSSEITLVNKRGKLDLGYIEVDEKDLFNKNKSAETPPEKPEGEKQENNQKKFDKWKG